MLRILIKWLLLAVVVLVVVLLLVVSVSYQRALDKGLQHTAKTAALPSLSKGFHNGILRVPVGEWEFRVRIAGCPPEGIEPDTPTALLLHGWPASSAMWLPLIEVLSAAGYCVVAPDQRGYSPGARPAQVEDYQVDTLSDDVVALADALGIERFHLIGHDWGAIVGWTTVMRAPQRLLSWTALSIPHPAAFGRAMLEDPEQRARSRYMFVLRTPWLAERLIGFNDFGLLRAGYASQPEQVRLEFLRLFREPEALTASLNWYRALDFAAQMDDLAHPVHVPTLFVWGTHDPAVAPRGVEWQREYLVGPFTEVALEAGHSLLVDDPTRVGGLVEQHLQRHGGP